MNILFKNTKYRINLIVSCVDDTSKSKSQLQKFLKTIMENFDPDKEKVFLNILVPTPNDDNMFVEVDEATENGVIAILYKQQNPEELKKHLPYPSKKIPVNMENAKKVVANINKYFARNWQEWRFLHWGTMEEATDFCIQHSNEKATDISFVIDAPPLTAMGRMSRRFPLLHFHLIYEAVDAPELGIVDARDGKFKKRKSVEENIQNLF